ncbi:hemerythrin domain-containing protein [Pseudoduganella plicata]|uniref:Hemerythrin n=1 Tax=Pseudoduganella plicata TaxID=321984 RepID=A0A4P7BJD8_9BURK|nr:hemerythrin domain-containing protein [Pseudoduganella plicata]QBQ39021.1 hemerythrin domain-containing protein [Pseudoduganella plicata]GGY86581.1 hemerythrin [Pseudoduganella plicata]
MTNETSDAIPLPTAEDHPAVKMPRGDKPTGNDAVALLTSDHDKAKQLFREYDRVARLGDVQLKNDLALQICLELTVHTQIEEELFYPAVRSETGDETMVRDAIQEHAEVKELIAHIQGMAADDQDMDDTVAMLRRAIEHHVEEEERDMFPQARRSDVDLGRLREQLADRKEQLEHDMGASPLRRGSHEAVGERSAIGQADS